DEVVRVAVRIEAATPADQGHPEVFVLLLERHDVVEELRLDVGGDVRLRELRLDQLRELQRGRAPGLDEKLELQWALADLGDELLRAVDVRLRIGLESRVVREVRR